MASKPPYQGPSLASSSVNWPHIRGSQQIPYGDKLSDIPSITILIRHLQTSGFFVTSYCVSLNANIIWPPFLRQPQSWAPNCICNSVRSIAVFLKETKNSPGYKIPGLLPNSKIHHSVHKDLQLDPKVSQVNRSEHTLSEKWALFLGAK
jgi:hypothetical protein